MNDAGILLLYFELDLFYYVYLIWVKFYLMHY